MATAQRSRMMTVSFDVQFIKWRCILNSYIKLWRKLEVVLSSNNFQNQPLSKYTYNPDLFASWFTSAVFRVRFFSHSIVGVSWSTPESNHDFVLPQQLGDIFGVWETVTTKSLPFYYSKITLKSSSYIVYLLERTTTLHRVLTTCLVRDIARTKVRELNLLGFFAFQLIFIFLNLEWCKSVGILHVFRLFWYPNYNYLTRSSISLKQ